MRCKGKGKRAKKIFLCCSRPATDSSDEELPESRRCQNHCEEVIVEEVESPPIPAEDIPSNHNIEQSCIEDHPDGDNIPSKIQTVLVEMHKGDPNEFEQKEGEDVINLPEIVVTIDNSEQTDYIDETDQEIQDVTNDMKGLGAELLESVEKSPIVKVLEAGEVMQSKAGTHREDSSGMSSIGDDMLEAVLEPIVTTKRRNSMPHIFTATAESYKCDVTVEQALEELSEHMAKEDDTKIPNITDELRQYVCDVIEKAVFEVSIEQTLIQDRLNTETVSDEIKPTVAEKIKVCDIVDDASNLTSEAEDEIVDDMIEFVIEEAISDMTVHTSVLNGSPLTKHISSPLMYQTSMSGSNMIWGRPDINISTHLHSHNMPVPSCATLSNQDKTDTSVTNSSAPSTASMDWDGYIPAEDVKTDDEQQTNPPP